MTCGAECCESTTGKFFSKHSKRYARQFRKKKFEKVQRVLLESAREAGIGGRTILDVGCGVGMLHQTLLTEGAASSTGVDMSDEMLNHARRFAAQNGLEGQTTYVNGDIVAIRNRIKDADITFMDKVVCCYENLPDLLSAAAEKTRDLLALSHPRDVWYVRWIFKLQIFISNLFRMSFRPWWHDWKRMEAMIEIEGLRLVKRKTAGKWMVLIYRRG